MKMLQALSVAALLVAATGVSYAQGERRMERDPGNYPTTFGPEDLRTGRSTGFGSVPRANCQRNMPSVSPNGNPSLSDTGLCR